MKNPFKKSNTELDLGKKETTGGIIGAGLSLLIGGLLVALQGDDLNRNLNNNQ
jgi:hypothetical protein